MAEETRISWKIEPINDGWDAVLTVTGTGGHFSQTVGKSTLEDMAKHLKATLAAMEKMRHPD